LAIGGGSAMMLGVFERFTERARQVVVLAQEEAWILKHDYIGTEHILLGLLREEEGLAARVLESLDITVERVRAQVVRIVGPGEEVTSGQIPFTPRSRKVLELALDEALSLGHNYIGTEHILLGLVRENEGVAARILLDFDADSEKIRNEVLRILNGHPPSVGRTAATGRRTAATGRRTAATGRSRRPRATPEPPEPALERIGLSDGLLDGAGPVLRALAAESEERLGRTADTGDLLVLLACVPEGLAARALAGLGIEAAGLVEAVEEARRGVARSTLLPPAALLAECETVRAEKEAALQAQELQRWAELRDRERTLLGQALRATEGPQQDLLARLRERLGSAPR